MVASNNNRIIIFFLLTLSLSMVFYFIPQIFIFKADFPLAQLAPAIIALILWNMFEEKDNLKTILKKRIVWVNKPDLQTLIVALIPVLIVPASVFLYQGNVSYNPISIKLIFWCILGAFTEELGWRAYLQYRLGLSNNIMVSTVSTAFLWYACQIDLILNSSIFYNILIFFLIFSFSIILSFIFYKSFRNITLCFVFHTIHNILIGVFVSILISNENFLFVLTLIYFITAIGIIIMNKKVFQLELEQW